MVLEDRTPQSGSSAGILSLYGEEEQMATSSYVGIDVSKDRLDVAVLGNEGVWQVDNTPNGIAKLVQQMENLQPELIVVEATGGYQGGVVEALFLAGLPVAVVNPARVRQFARACG
jgi:transposase